MAKLKINNLHASVGDKEILKGINLEIETGQIHAIMGPNGNGKSTLLSVIMGSPKYVVTEGEVLLDGQDILSMGVDERSKAGLFLGMQYPQEIPGITNSDFMKAAMNAHREKPISLYQFIKTYEGAMESLKMKSDVAHRFLNEGFSGGEKKRNEILQMKMLQPKIALLDEIDSGLDVDAMHIVSDAINTMIGPDFGALVVSHYERFFELVKPTHVHVLVDGRIVMSGGQEIVKKIDESGYNWIKEELDIELEQKQTKRMMLGACAVNEK